MTYETKRLPDTINKAFKYQLRPNKEQRGALAKAFGCARFVYNYFLNLAIDTYKRTGKGLYFEEQCKLLVSLKKNPDYEWLKEVPSQTLQQSFAIFNLPTKISIKNEQSSPGSRKNIINNPSASRREFAWKAISSTSPKLVG